LTPYCQRKHKGSFAERFWARVNKHGLVADGMKTSCWLWTGRLEKNGYARVKRADSRQQVSVHRAAWELLHGEVPAGMFVLHKCAVRHCVRHLSLGTHQDNMNDMFRKGRARKAQGARHGHAKLTPQQVIDIVRRRLSGDTPRELATAYGVCEAQIGRICTGKRWKEALAGLGTYEYMQRGKKVQVSFG
jgi:hypothetical protein